MRSIERTITEPQEALLLNALRQNTSQNNRPWVQHRNYTIALLMLDAGLRVGEVCGLHISQLMFVGEPVTSIDIPAPESKNNCGRSVPCTTRIRNAISQMNNYYWQKINVSPEFYAFYTVNPMLPITPRQVQRLIRVAAMRALGFKVHPHALRHTFATKILRKTNVRVTQKLLGHKSIQSTQVYTHPDSTDLEQAIDQLN